MLQYERVFGGRGATHVVLITLYTPAGLGCPTDLVEGFTGNGTVASTGDQVVTIAHCMTGYRPDNREVNTTCQADSQWAQDKFHCTGINGDNISLWLILLCQVMCVSQATGKRGREVRDGARRSVSNHISVRVCLETRGHLHMLPHISAGVQNDRS